MSRILTGVLLLAGAGLQAYAAQPSLQFAEPVTIDVDAARTDFDAYGRRFSLVLTSNERLLAKLPAQRKRDLAGYRLYRGSLSGQPKSWVRLTQWQGHVEGAIWDGEDFYSVTTLARIAPFLTSPIDGAPDQTVMFRLSDARDLLPLDYCGVANATAAAAPNGLEQYRALLSEISTQIVSATLTREIEISLIGDSAFQTLEPMDANAAMLARLNIVEGIFSEQVSTLILATDVRLIPAGSDPFSSSRGATLLEQLGRYRKDTPAVSARGLAHLITGKDLEGTTAGIAYVKSVCDVERGVSVSERSFSTTISALIMAHELAHNFGAEHDGEAGTPCASTSGSGFLMGPSVSGYSTFSQCSIDTMRPVMDEADCMHPAEYADINIDAATNNVSGEGAVPFTLPFILHSQGNLAAENVAVTVTLPTQASLVIQSASSSAGACTVNGNEASCQLGDMEIGVDQTVSVTALATQATNFTAQARVTADNDRLSSNNAQSLPVAIRSGVDAAVLVTASASEVPLGSPLQIFIDVSAQRAQALRGAVLSANFNQAVTSATLAGGTCTVSASAVNCSLPDVAPGTTRRVVVTTNTTAAGPLYATAGVSVSGDGDLTNNNASGTAWVQADRDVEIAAGPVAVTLDVGAGYDVPLTLRSRGTSVTADVTLRISLTSTAAVVETLEAGGVACLHPDSASYECVLGPLAAGATRAITLRLRGASPGVADLIATALVADDQYLPNNSAQLQLRLDHAVDLAVMLGSGGYGLEDASIEGQVSLRSNGRNAAVGAALVIDLNAAGLLSSATIHGGAPCVLENSVRARCALPAIARNAQLHVDFMAQFAEPGDYEVTYTVTAPGDTEPSNNTLTRPVLVRPFNDIGVEGDIDFETFLVGGTRQKTFIVTTERRALAAAEFLTPHYLPAMRVEAISAPAGVCRVDDDAGGICDFTGLPAFARVPVTVTYRALAGPTTADTSAAVSTAGDVDSDNDEVKGFYDTQGVTDIELRVLSAEVASVAFTEFAYPQIQLVNGAEKAFNARLEITLPSQVTLVSVSAAGAICSGDAVLRCEFSEIAPNSTANVDIVMRAVATGSFASSLHVSTGNDTNALNDARQVTLRITGASSAAPRASGGKGGGRFDWLMLAALALLKWAPSFPGQKRIS